MVHLLVLVGATVLIGLLAWATWKRTRSLAFLIGTGALYLWSLYGAWFIVGDDHVGNLDGSYQYLFQKLFPVAVDAMYLQAILLYTLFLVSVQTAVLLTARRDVAQSQFDPIRVSHTMLWIMGAVALGGSFLIVRDNLVEAALFNRSGYAVTAAGHEATPLFVIHQVLSRFAIIPAGLGLAIVASGPGGRWLVGGRGLRVVTGYVALLMATFAFSLAMGNKNELLFALIFSLLFYVGNSPAPRVGRLAVIGTVAFLGVALVDFVRALPLLDLATGFDAAKAWAVVSNIWTSNEAFAAHMSMYGVLHEHVPLTYGSSLVSLAASVVPRVLWESRPAEIYYHYVASVGAAEGQGYTIHHATAWYLNFGVAGVVMGGAMLGLIWSWLRERQLVSRGGSGLIRCAWTVGFFAFTAGLPNFVRSGPEAYKPIVVYSILFPAFIVWASALAVRFARALDRARTAEVLVE